MKILSSHLFSIYLENLTKLASNSKVGQRLVFDDKSLYQRLVQVLRLKTGEHFVLFDKNINIKCELEEQTFEQKKVCARIFSSSRNQPLVPEIVFCPSILKKNAFEEIIYSAAEMGANTIQPIIPEKGHANWWSSKEESRCHNIMKSACEQSKNFILPKFFNPIALKNFLKTSGSDVHAKKVIFEFGGQSVLSLMNEIKQEKIEKIIISFGPEGGFTDQEIEFFRQSGFTVYSLTTTTLRAQQAVAVGLGLIRSVG
jgi:16S rRNA (uracil1498-N3)-methyltransferase